MDAFSEPAKPLDIRWHCVVNAWCFGTYLLAIPEFLRHSFAPGMARRIIHEVIASADRAVGLPQAATRGVARCCQVNFATRQNTKGNTGVVSGEPLNGFPKEMWKSKRRRRGDGRRCTGSPEYNARLGKGLSSAHLLLTMKQELCLELRRMFK